MLIKKRTLCLLNIMFAILVICVLRSAVSPTRKGWPIRFTFESQPLIRYLIIILE